MDASLERRGFQLKALIACGALAGIALSPKLWIASRAYPLSPVFPGLPVLAGPWHIALVALFVLSVAAAALGLRPFPAIFTALGAGTALVCLDQSRLQPWFYQYLLMLGALAWFYSSPDEERRRSALNACRLLTASIYFWSGAQKINPRFTDNISAWMARPLEHALPGAVPALLRAGAAAPFIEIAIGLGLLIPRTRRLALCAAIAMHSLLLLALGPLWRNSNTAVWPWNLVMIGADIALFRRTSGLPAQAVLIPPGPAAWRAAVLFAALSPALSLAGVWDNYLSWSLYSGNKDEATFYTSGAVFDRLPAEAQDHVYENDSGPDTLDVYDWSWDELNVPVYPELRIYRRIAETLCRHAVQPGDIRVRIRRKFVWSAKARATVDFDCSQSALERLPHPSSAAEIHR